MKIALYYPWIYLKSGVERTILETVKRSKHEFTIFTNHYDQKGTYPEFKKYKVIELKKVPVDRRIMSVLKAAFIIAFQKIDFSSFDILLIHSDGLGDLILNRNRNIPAVCFCHTPLRPVFDSEYRKRALSKLGYLGRGIYIILATVFKYIDRHLWKRYKLVIFNSKESLRRAKEGALLESKKYYLLHPGVDLKKNQPTGKFAKYFFVPGRIMWTKNIELAIEAFKIFTKENSNSGFKLIIAGQVDKKSTGYYEKLKAISKGNGNIKFVLNPSDRQMWGLYRDCYTVLATPFNEDWGMTALEANSFAKPVIAVNRGGFLESQIQGKTGFLVTGRNRDFSSAMTRLADNITLTRRLGKNAFAHVRKYDLGIFIKKLDTLLGSLD